MVVVIGVPVAAIVALQGPAGAGWAGVDWSDPIGWLGIVPLETALVALARFVALTASYLLVATSVAHLVAVATGHGRLARLTGRITAPAVRRLVDRVVAGSVAMSVLAGPALAAPAAQHPAPVVVDPIEQRTEAVIDPVAPLVPEGYAPDAYRVEPEEHPERPADAPEGPAARQPKPPDAPTPRPTPPPAETSASVPPPGTVGDPDPPDSGTTTVTVRPGDSIWKLAEHRLRDHLGRPVSDPEVAPYWRVAVDANAGKLRSGDPDLIFPGERITLPDPRDFTRVGS